MANRTVVVQQKGLCRQCHHVQGTLDCTEANRFQRKMRKHCYWQCPVRAGTPTRPHALVN